MVQGQELAVIKGEEGREKRGVGGWEFVSGGVSFIHFASLCVCVYVCVRVSIKDE